MRELKTKYDGQCARCASDIETGALIKFHEDGKPFACIYHHCDGYPEGLGKNLAEFLKDKAITNGIAGKDTFNGMPCLAASVVEHLKDGPGGVYLYAPEESDVGEEFRYAITECGSDRTTAPFGKGTPCISCYAISGKEEECLSTGTPEEFLKWIEKREA